VDLYLGMESIDFDFIRVGEYGTLSGQNTYFIGVGILIDTFRRWTDNTQHLFSGRKIILLYRAQGLCRCCITCQDNQVASQIKKFEYTFFCELINSFKGTCSIRDTRIIAQINIIVLWQCLMYFPEYRQTAISRIKYTYWAFVVHYGYLLI